MISEIGREVVPFLISAAAYSAERSMAVSASQFRESSSFGQSSLLSFSFLRLGKTYIALYILKMQVN